MVFKKGHATYLGSEKGWFKKKQWITKACLQCRNDYEITPCRAAKSKYCSKACLATHKFTGLKREAPKTAFKKGMVPWNKGKKKYQPTLEQLEKYKKISKTTSWHIWKKIIKKIQGHNCILCNEKNNIHVHHIMKKAKWPDKYYDIDNGIVLCKYCHRKTYNQEEKFEEYFFTLSRAMLKNNSAEV